jgi:hypothetical protein
MPRISNTVPPEMFDAMRARVEAADLARADGNPDYDSPVLPTFPDVIEGKGGYPQPQWPDDVILPDNKDPMEQETPIDSAPQQPLPPPLPDHIPRPEATPEPEVIETSQVDEQDGELAAQTTFGNIAEIAELATSKLEGLPSGTRVSPEVEAATSGIGSTFREIGDKISDVGHRLLEAAEKVENDGVVEAGTDDIYEAEAAPIEADDDNDPYDSDV